MLRVNILTELLQILTRADNKRKTQGIKPLPGIKKSLKSQFRASVFSAFCDKAPAAEKSSLIKLILNSLIRKYVVSLVHDAHT